MADSQGMGYGASWGLRLVDVEAWAWAWAWLWHKEAVRC
ncbi:hypothetical protein ES332_A11G293000v1 [Gossypium tomentosum]|uniref:Uncharacterized protein n=1 Tax=Gossypium tomentosum TaxID=34277 RepID=A0A5D2NG05_GOSTO|nr:hypothetical protein ES332_A11G293000v1 [Gossypium tomentosum]